MYSSLQNVAIAGLTAGALFCGAIPAAVFAGRLRRFPINSIESSTGAVAVSYFFAIKTPFMKHCFCSDLLVLCMEEIYFSSLHGQTTHSNTFTMCNFVAMNWTADDTLWYI